MAGPMAIPLSNDQSTGFLRVVTPAARAAADSNVVNLPEKEQLQDGLAGYITNLFTQSRNHRMTYGHDDRLLKALRTYKGQYDPNKLGAIKQLDGSDVYARLTAMKCRSASALLRDIYLGTERPWGLRPTPAPVLPDDITQQLTMLVQSEVQNLRANGQQVEPSLIAQRIRQLKATADAAQKEQAAKDAERAEDQLDDVLVQGGFYKALAEMLVDLPIFPFACIKGPVVRMHTTVKWQKDGTAQVVETPRLFWDRVSPFDLYFSPNASRIEDSYVIERVRTTRSQLEGLRQLPGYSAERIEDILERTRYGSVGLGKAWLSYFEYERAELENRDPHHRVSDTIDMLEYHGYAPGSLLREWGLSETQVKDEYKEYFVTAWLIDNYVIKAVLNKSPRQRPIYYPTSFERMPGSIIGNGLCDILEDIQDVGNAALRALVNNMGIASGPQVAILEDRVAPGADSEAMYPWKRWKFNSDPLATSAAIKPIEFFQPDSRASELLGIYKAMSEMADEISALPRYMTGSQRTGGAAATASGLSMLMGNASKVLQQVASNVDEDVIQNVVEEAYAYAMVSMPGVMSGDEEIEVRGVTTAMAREQDRVRQLEYLNVTNNPTDLQIIGIEGRAKLLASLAKTLGLDDTSIVPDQDKIKQMEAAQQQAQAAAAGGQPAPGGPPQAAHMQGQLPGPDAGRSDGGTPRMDTVSNRSTT